MNLHVGDVGHSVILGATGGGKSTLVSWILCNHRRYSGSRIVVLDKDYSQRLTVYALQGRYMTLGDEQHAHGVATTLAPLRRCTPDNADAMDVAFTWLNQAMQSLHVEMSAKRQQALRDALVRISHESPDFKNLNHLHIEEPACREALHALNSGMAQDILNGCDNPFYAHDVMGIDCGALLQNNTLSVHAVTIMDALFNSLQEVFSDHKPTLLVLEEAWLYLKHPLFQAKLSDWLKTLRKANVSVLLVSQEIADIVHSPLQSTLQSACMTRIYCANKAAKETTLCQHYQSLGLTAEQIDTIATMQPKHDYYCQSPHGTQLFQLDLGSLAKALLCQTNPNQRQRLMDVLRSEDVDTLITWLDLQGLHQWSDYLKNSDWVNFPIWEQQNHDYANAE